MLYDRYNRGPRGRMYGHGGRRPGLMILGILGLIGFAPIGLAVLFGLLVGAMGVIGGLIGAAASVLSELPAATYSGGLFVGILIGLILYNRKKKGNAASDEKQETETPRAPAREETEYYPTETFRSNGA